jgi:UDPglucose 6-dehydrogenase/GDP-mannose 6-dehydrogenase
MRVSVIGTGYVGLVSGVCLAEKGHRVICVDVDEQKVAMINQGIPPIYEKDLEEMLTKNVGPTLNATTDLSAAVRQTDISLIAVGTPFDGDSIDLSFIEKVSKQIGEALRSKADYHVVIVKSTVVPGTTDDVVRPILEGASRKRAGIDFGVGMNPEFLREGEAVEDFMNPDRIVLGADCSRTLDRMKELYRPFSNVDTVSVNTKTAEMIKYTANALLATMISFSNEIANLCVSIGDIDVVDVMKGVHLDKRLTPITGDGARIIPAFTTYIEAGCGFGGSCFPKDVNALIAHGKRAGMPMRLLEAVVEINARQPFEILALLEKHFPSLNAVRLAVLGLAFKPGTDDMRESPAIPVVQELLSRRAIVKAYDPVASREAQRIFGQNGIQYCETLPQALEDVDGIIILTRWDAFKDLPDMIQKRHPQPVVIDGRRMLDKKRVADYDGIGLGASARQPGM